MSKIVEFKSYLSQAKAKRTPCCLTFLCLVHPKLDAPYDVLLHQYGDHAFLQTQSAKQDSHIEEWSQVLKESQLFQSLWLKNHSPLREKNGLIQRDELLWGFDTKTISGTAEEFFFEYHTQDTLLLPLAYRSILKLTKFGPESNSSKERLWVLHENSELCLFIKIQKQRLKLKDMILSYNTPHWAEACHQLRQNQKTHSEIICELPSVAKSEKNTKAIFHFFYQLTQNLSPQGQMFFLIPENTTWALALWKRASQALKRNFVFRKLQSGEPDIPLLNTQKSSLRIIFEFQEIN